jgi:hypothetical protein
MWTIARLLYLAGGAAVTCWLIAIVRRSWKRLDERIAAFRAEQEANQGPPMNPYLALAEIYAEAEMAERRGKTRKPPR